MSIRNDIRFTNDVTRRLKQRDILYRLLRPLLDFRRVFVLPFENGPILDTLDFLHQHPPRVGKVIHLSGKHIAKIGLGGDESFAPQIPDHPFRVVCADINIAFIDRACAEEFDLMLISDEVYEFFTLDAADHISTASLPGAFERTITVSSFSKSWAVSGWRLGYACGPGALIGKLTQLGNIYYVCTPTPLQHALARVLLADPGYYDRLRVDFAHKREIITSALERAGFSVYPSRSSFYVWVRIPPRFSEATELNDFLIREAGVAGVPGSAFMDDPDRDVYMRFCFAREDAMLTLAAEQIVKALA